MVACYVVFSIVFSVPWHESQESFDVIAAIESNANKIQSGDVAKEACLELLYLDNYLECPVLFQSLPPSKFVGHLNSKFGMRELIMFSTIGNCTFPQFVHGYLQLKNLEPSNQWREESARFLCYRIQSDHEFRESYLRLVTWSTRRLYRADSGYVGLRDFLLSEQLDQCLVIESHSRWRSTLEVVCVAYLVDFPNAEDSSLDVQEMRALKNQLSEYVSASTFLPTTSGYGWKRDPNGRSFGYDALPPTIGGEPVENWPGSLSEDATKELIRAVLCD